MFTLPAPEEKGAATDQAAHLPASPSDSARVSLKDYVPPLATPPEETFIRPVESLIPEWSMPVPGGLTPGRPKRSVVILADDKAVKSLIEMLIDRAGLTQADLAQRMGLRIQTINQYKMLRRKRPSIQWLVRLIQACGARLTVEWPDE